MKLSQTHLRLEFKRRGSPVKAQKMPILKGLWQLKGPQQLRVITTHLIFRS
jgi:hypothetical protein